MREAKARIFQRFHQELAITDAQLAQAIDIPRQHVTDYRNPDASRSPSLIHLMQMPDLAVDFIFRELSAYRASRGFGVRRWVAVAADERGGGGKRLASVERELADMRARFDALHELVKQMAGERR